MRIAFRAAQSEEARAAKAAFERDHGARSLEEADLVVALGGDGFMLETLHELIDRDVPIYGMNLGTVGFLLNDFHAERLIERIEAAETVRLHPLRMTARTASGERLSGIAINEVSLFRETRQAAKLRVRVEGVERLAELVCDGLLLATPAGTTAYNLSAHGPILPVGSPLLALTPISPFRPRRWRGALLPSGLTVGIDVIEAEKRPVSAVADHTEVRDVRSVEIWEDKSRSLRLLFDPEHNLEERILLEQFAS